MAEDRRTLAQELVNLERKHADDFKRMDELKAALKKIATVDGENFKEVFDGKGKVSVSGAADPKFKGIFPEVDVKVLLELPDATRKKLEKDGVIKMIPTYGEPYYGRVSVELF